MAGELRLAAETYIWGLQGICQLHRIPFASKFVLQQFPPPYDLSLLQRAGTALGLKCGWRDVRLAELPGLPAPFLVAVDAELKTEGHGGDGPPCRLAIVLKCDESSILYRDDGESDPASSSLEAFGGRFAGKVMLCVPEVQALKAADAASAESAKFGFRWFVPELLRHRSIWRDVLLASFAIQLMALATEGAASGHREGFSDPYAGDCGSAGNDIVDAGSP